MIEPYNINTDFNFNSMLGSIMEWSFFILIIFLTILILVSLIIWLIRSQDKVRKSSKICNKKFYNKSSNTNSNISNTNFNCFYRIDGGKNEITKYHKKSKNINYTIFNFFISYESKCLCFKHDRNTRSRNSN